MIFKNAFHLLVDNFSLVYKYLLYRIIVAVIAIALAAALIVPNIAFLFESAELKSLTELIRDFLKALVSGNVDFLSTFPEQFKGAVSALGHLLASKTSNFVFVSVSAVIVILLSRFLSGVGNFVLGGLIDDKMSSYAKTSFTSAYIRNLGKASLWQIIYVPVTFVYDVVMLAVCYLFFLALMSIISFTLLASGVALMLSVALLLVSQAVKLTVFNCAVPALVSDKSKLSKAFSKTFSHARKHFGSLFSTYLITSLIILCITVGGSVFSFGAALLITIPVSLLMLVCIQFVSFYTYEKRKYFLGEDKIVTPKEDATEETFYDNFEL